jgi:hypothetical protein
MMKLHLTAIEKASLRKQKIKISDLATFAVDEIEAALDVPHERARVIYALATFQTIPSLGIRFAEDLIFMGYYSLDELKEKDGARLVEEFERKKGYWIDSCVEDQFRLAVYAANNEGCTKNWWDFTAARKKYRAKHGYPADRPHLAWYDLAS